MSAIENGFAGVRALLATFVPAAVPAVELAGKLAGLEEGRQQQFDRMERKIDDVRDGPYRTGLSLLSELSVSGEHQSDLLGEAAGKFVDAHAIYENDPAHAFWAAFHIASLRWVLGAPPRARHWVMIAHKEAVQAARAECDAANRLMLGKRSYAPRTILRGGLAVGVIAALVAGAAAIAIVALVLYAIGIPSITVIAGPVGAIWLGRLAFTAGAGGYSSVTDSVTASVDKRYAARTANARDLASAVETIGGMAVDFGVPVSPATYHLIEHKDSRTLAYEEKATAAESARAAPASATATQTSDTVRCPNPRCKRLNRSKGTGLRVCGACGQRFSVARTRDGLTAIAVEV